MTTNDGGPAFPNPGRASPNGGWIIEPGSGLTMRDYFAAHALAGLLANGDWYDRAASVSHEGGPRLGDLAAARAYDVADAMLRAREEAT